MGRPWDWHVQRTVLYCTVHFKRGVDSGPMKDEPEAKLMKEILLVEDKTVCPKNVC